MSGLGQPGEASWKSWPVLMWVSGLRRVWVTEEAAECVCDNMLNTDSPVPAVELHFPTHRPVSWQDVADLSGAGVQTLINPGLPWRDRRAL